MHTPVVLIMFNRPQFLKPVFEQVRACKPPQIFVVADGPRVGFPDDAEKCAQSLAILDSIDWECNVVKQISPVNLGCGHRIASGLSWVFDQVESAIIVEDDCLPDLSFFQFCEELLERYRDDKRVMSIGGNNLAYEWSCADSYFFSKHFPCHGWASWARAWKHFDFSMEAWRDPAVKTDIRNYLRDDKLHYKQTKDLFDQIEAGRRDTWDFQWYFAHQLTRSLSAIPHVNLVTHIGYGLDCAHTKESTGVKSQAIDFPLRHPPQVVVDKNYDRFWIRKAWPEKPKENALQRLRQLARRGKRLLKQLLLPNNKP